MLRAPQEIKKADLNGKQIENSSFWIVFKPKSSSASRIGSQSFAFQSERVPFQWTEKSEITRHELQSPSTPILWHVFTAEQRRYVELETQQYNSHPP